MIKKTLLLMTFIFSTTPLYAVQPMKKCVELERSTAEYTQCLDVIKKSIDRELQTWVNNHVFNLEEKALVTGRYSALKMFKRSQTNFISFRENDCRWQYLAISPEKGAGLAYKKCYISLTQTRITQLSLIE